MRRPVPLPPHFRFGVGNSDHQTEAFEPGQPDFRDVWEAENGLTTRGRATDFWNRYEEDVALAASLGCRMFRFSLAWSRLEPEPGVFSEPAFEHYRQVCRAIRRHGMEPMVTLHHFTWPLHVEQRGGMIDPAFPDWFDQYAAEVARQLGREADWWITFNEPTQLVYGYIKPFWSSTYFMPPGLPPGATFADQARAMGALVSNLFVGHTRARARLRAANDQAKVGANPMVLGLPPWLQGLVDWNATRVRDAQALRKQGRRFAATSLLARGKADVVLAALTRTRDRADQVAFSRPYFFAAQRLLVRQDGALRRAADVGGAAVAVTRGTTAESLAPRVLPHARCVGFDTPAAAAAALRDGGVEAVLGDDTVLRPLAAEGGGALVLGEEKLSDEPYAAAVPVGSTALLEKVDAAVARFAGAPPSGLGPLRDRLQLAAPADDDPQLRRIRRRGYVTVAISEGVPGFSTRDPVSGERGGLEIELAKEIARELLGDPSKVRWVAVDAAHRMTPLRRWWTRLFTPLTQLFAVLSTVVTSNWWHLGMAGKLSTGLCPPQCVGQQDFVGLDYYWGISTLGLHKVRSLMDAIGGKYARAPVWPGALRGMLDLARRLFPDKPVIIVENGCVANASGVSRPEYLRAHFEQVRQALRRGVNVKGYLVWSITSNRELGLPFDEHSDFGLFHIDLDSDPALTRTRTGSADAYAQLIATAGAGAPPPAEGTPRRGPRAKLAGLVRDAFERTLELSNRLRLPGPSVLPVAGAIVGVYSGLAAGIFASLIGLISALVFGLPRLLHTLRAPELAMDALEAALAGARWHPEYAIVGVPLSAAALLLARLIEPGAARDEVKKRLNILALLVLGALSLYYPLVLLSALNDAWGHAHDVAGHLARLPLWAVVAAPALGGLLVGRLLRHNPEIHGHGVPEVVMAVRKQGGLPAEGGLLKLFASSITIGSGGSAGREGPIVYGGAAFAAAVGRTLGFSRKELAILMASGAGAGIAASFNAPIAGAIFAMEIILREFELKVFSPIILASVTATMVGRGVMGKAQLLQRIGYDMVSGWEILAYAVLGLLTGLIAYAFVRFLHHAEAFFSGRFPGRLSGFLGRQSMARRAAIGGLLVGLLAMLSPPVWGTGHDFVNFAHARQLTVGVLILGAAAKLLATGITIGSGGSGGTFFPMVVVGALTGGAFGEVLHDLFPQVTAASGAYAMVGMGGAVAGLNRGALTGMMIVYELSGNYAVMLPLMVTCTIASALAHTLVERRAARLRTDADILAETKVRALVVDALPLPESLPVREVADRLLGSGEPALPVIDADGRVLGIVELDHLRDVWKDSSLVTMLRATDVLHPVPAVRADADLAHALERMDHHDVDALPVVDGDKSHSPFGLLSRTAVRRYLYRQRAKAHAEGEHAVAPTELER